MGFHFSITLYNQATRETKEVAFFSLDDYVTAWEHVTRTAITVLKEHFEIDKYWVISEIKDVTLR